MPKGNPLYYKPLANIAYAKIGEGAFDEAISLLEEVKKLKNGMTRKLKYFLTENKPYVMCRIKKLSSKMYLLRSKVKPLISIMSEQQNWLTLARLKKKITEPETN